MRFGRIKLKLMNVERLVVIDQTLAKIDFACVTPARGPPWTNLRGWSCWSLNIAMLKDVGEKLPAA